MPIESRNFLCLQAERPALPPSSDDKRDNCAKRLFHPLACHPEAKPKDLQLHFFVRIAGGSPMII
jgi:hypothetical protein